MRIFPTLAIVLFLAPATSLATLYPSKYELILSTGEKVHIDGFVEMYAGGSKEWMLAIQYDVGTIESVAILCKRAKLIWPHLRPFVEAKGWSWGNVRADKKTTTTSVTGVKKTESVGYGVAFQKVNGKWTTVNKECAGDL